MGFQVWQALLIVGLLLAVGLAAAAFLLRRSRNVARPLMKAAARRLGGRLDPASENARCPAILVEIDGRLLRASGWPIDLEVGGSDPPPYLEVCTPVEGPSSAILVVRRSVLTRLLPLLSEDLRTHADADVPEAGISIFGAQHAPWAPHLFAAHPTWILLELDNRMLRVLTHDPQHDAYGVDLVAQIVRQFGAAVPGILTAAGVSRSPHAPGREQ